jgi:hypothetical protein
VGYWALLSATNQVPLLLTGSGVARNFKSPVAYNHYSLLRTIEDALGLPTLRKRCECGAYD